MVNDGVGIGDSDSKNVGSYDYALRFARILRAKGGEIDRRQTIDTY